MARVADKKLLKLASALISMGALVSCDDGTETISYSDEITGEQMPEPQLAKLEQCYGVSLTMQNDCATKKLSDCAGTADKDYLPDKWKYVPAGSCETQGGSLLAKEREDKDEP